MDRAVSGQRRQTFFYPAGSDPAAYAKGARGRKASLCADRVCARGRLGQLVRLAVSGAIMKDKAGAEFVISPCQFDPAEASKGDV